MSVGLETFDASGNALLRITDRIGGVLGVANTGKSNGSITHAAFANGTPWIACMNPSGFGLTIPKWTISSSSISWTFGVSGANYNEDVRFFYGVR